jgi:hypothetical protein
MENRLLWMEQNLISMKNDPEEQEKRIKYNDLVANAGIFQNVCDITLILWELSKEGYVFSKKILSCLAPIWLGI